MFFFPLWCSLCSGWSLCRAVSHSPWADASVSGTGKAQYQMLAGTATLGIQTCQPQACSLLGSWTRRSLTGNTLRVFFLPGRMICNYSVTLSDMWQWFSVWQSRDQHLHLCLPCHPTVSVASLLYRSSVDGLLAFGSHSSFFLRLNSGSWNWLGLNLISKLLPGFSLWAWIPLPASFKET